MRFSILCLATTFGMLLLVADNAHAEDGIVIAKLVVEGTIPKPDSKAFDRNPYAKDRVPYAYVGGFSGGEFCIEVVAKDKSRALTWMTLDNDKNLKEQAQKFVGQRVVVECKGEYKLQAGKQNVRGRNGEWYAEDIVSATLVLTALKIELAK